MAGSSPTRATRRLRSAFTRADFPTLECLASRQPRVFGAVGTRVGGWTRAIFTKSDPDRRQLRKKTGALGDHRDRAPLRDAIKESNDEKKERIPLDIGTQL
jgi:hypothetical protein